MYCHSRLVYRTVSPGIVGIIYRLWLGSGSGVVIVSYRALLHDQSAAWLVHRVPWHQIFGQDPWLC